MKISKLIYAYLLFSLLNEGIAHSSEIANGELCTTDLAPVSENIPIVINHFIDGTGNIQIGNSESNVIAVTILTGDRRLEMRETTSKGHMLPYKMHFWENIFQNEPSFHITIKKKTEDYQSVELDKKTFIKALKNSKSTCNSLFESSDIFTMQEQQIISNMDNLSFLRWALNSPISLSNIDRELVESYNELKNIIPRKTISKKTFDNLKSDKKFIYIPQFDKASNFHNGTAAVKTNEKWGLINTDLDWITKPTYDNIYYFNDKTMSVEKNNLWGIINYKGEVILKPSYAFIDSCVDGICAYKKTKDKKTNNWGYIDLNNGKILSPVLEKANRFRDGYSSILDRDGDWSIIDKNYEFQYSKKSTIIKKLYSPSQGLSIFVDKNNRRGFFDLKGNVAISAKYIRARRFSEGLAAVKNKDGWGFVDRKGRTIITHQFSQVKDFNEGLAPVADKSKKWGYINTSGKFVIAPKYLLAYPFYEGTAIIRLINTSDLDKPFRAFINKSGKLLFDYNFEDVYRFSEGVAAVKIYDKWGFVSD